MANGQGPTTISVLMRFAANARVMHYRRLSTNLAAGTCGGHSRRRLVILQQMLSSYVARGEQGNKRGWHGRLFYIRTPSRFLALHEAHYAYYFKTEFPRRFNRLHRRA